MREESVRGIRLRYAKEEKGKEGRRRARCLFPAAAGKGAKPEARAEDSGRPRFLNRFPLPRSQVFSPSFPLSVWISLGVPCNETQHHRHWLFNALKGVVSYAHMLSCSPLGFWP